MKLLTISVAAYNVEAYLDRLMQSLTDSGVMEQLEILVVDDGSQDSTTEIALNYQKWYPDSVRLIRKENGGHGSTINRGIREASGKYFRTLDGDDWLHSGHLKALVEQMEKIDADIILSNFCNCYADGTEDVIDDFPALEDGNTYSFDELQSRVEWMRIHTVIYRTSLLKEHGITLDEHCFYVDAEFMLYPIPFVETIYTCKPYLYCYRLGQPGQSVSRNGRIKHIEDGARVSRSLLDFYQENAPQLPESKKKYFVEGIANHCLFHFKSLMMLPASPASKKKVLSFERFVREADPEIFEKMAQKGERSRMLKLVRRSHYLIYYPMNWYKNHLKKK